MWNSLSISFLIGIFSAVTGTALSQQGDHYAKMQESLRQEILATLPEVDPAKKEAFLLARKAEVAATERLVQTQGQVGDLATARALVGHAKGKWIGGANKGIAAAQAKLKNAKTAAEREGAEKELAHWQQNLKDGEEALAERQAKLGQAERDRDTVEKAQQKAAAALAAAKTETARAVEALGLKPLLASPLLDAKLALFVALQEAPAQSLADFAAQGEEQQKTLAWTLSSDDLLVEMAVADGPQNGHFAQAMEVYRQIWEASDKVGEGALKRLALAISLEHAVPIKQRNAVAATEAPAYVDPVKRYLHYEKALLAGELDPAFATLSTWDIRMVVNGEEPDEILTWGREMLRNYRPDHITTNDYRWRYVAAVRSDIRYGSQDNIHDREDLQFFQNILMNGGICGRRAFFGRFILRAFGIPTTARPQRGHAALAHWTPDGWVVCLGGGWGTGWTKTRYDRDLDFLATTQARMTGDPFLQVKRAQWIGDVMGEPKVYGCEGKKEPAFWYAVSLYTQRQIIATAQSQTLAAVGEDIGEANETREKVAISQVEVSTAEQSITINAEGALIIPAVATSKPTKSTGKLIFMVSPLGGKVLHYGRNGGNENFEYTFDAPAAGDYELTAQVVTPSWKQFLNLSVNGSDEQQEIALPFTVGHWEETAPIKVTLKKGENVLTFYRNHENLKGATFGSFALRPLR